VRNLQPRYIRIDHLYDFYEVVGKTNGKLTYNWEKLDRVVDDILAAGAIPFFSLSYMPAVISSADSVSPPANWNDWAAVVKATIEHFSGRKGKNLSGVYYEVWNEPDLFGQWTLNKKPNYLLLYTYSVQGASQVKNTNPFKIGGPAITDPKERWLLQFLDYVDKNNLRLDFISWHRYARRVEIFENDLKELNAWLWQKPQFLHTEKIITEWGSDSNNNKHHDSLFDAAHTIAVIRRLLGQVHLAFSFEIKDGPDPGGKEYWGRWGLLTHEDFGKHQKPRYQAIKFLNELGQNRLSLLGEGTWVTGFSTKKGKTIKLLLVNFAPFSRHIENVPVTFAELDQGIYSYQESFLLGKKKNSKEKVLTDSLIKQIYMPPNSIVLVQLIKL
jgi:beta-xylosidase